MFYNSIHRVLLPRQFGRSLATLSKPPASNTPMIVRPSKEEIKTSRLSPQSVEIAVRHIHCDGLVVIEDVVPHADLDALNIKMVDDARTLQARGEDGPFNYNLGNLQQDAPPVAKYFYPSIFITNAAMPPLEGASPQRQPVHADADFAFPDHPFALVVNVPLVTMTPDNGSTEIWLGTHNSDISVQEGAHGERASGRIRKEVLDQRAGVTPPIQPVVKKGSIVLRDLRLWHAGMPNRTEEVRIMLAMIHFAPWYRNSMRLRMAKDVRPILESAARDGTLGLETPVDWIKTEDALDEYLNRGFGNSYDFNQSP